MYIVYEKKHKNSLFSKHAFVQILRSLLRSTMVSMILLSRDRQRLSMMMFQFTDIGLSNEKIFIPDTKLANSGQYICKATNTHGTATIAFHVNVIGRYLNACCCKC